MGWSFSRRVWPLVARPLKHFFERNDRYPKEPPNPNNGYLAVSRRSVAGTSGEAEISFPSLRNSKGDLAHLVLSYWLTGRNLADFIGLSCAIMATGVFYYDK
jgi:hypothetical protein